MSEKTRWRSVMIHLANQQLHRVIITFTVLFVRPYVPGHFPISRKTKQVSCECNYHSGRIERVVEWIIYDTCLVMFTPGHVWGSAKWIKKAKKGKKVPTHAKNVLLGTQDINFYFSCYLLPIPLLIFSRMNDRCRNDIWWTDGCFWKKKTGLNEFCDPPGPM